MLDVPLASVPASFLSPFPHESFSAPLSGDGEEVEESHQPTNRIHDPINQATNQPCKVDPVAIYY